MTILPRGAIHGKESAFLHIGLVGRKKYLVQKNIYHQAIPFTGKILQHWTKTRSDLLFIYKLRGGTFIKVIILIQTSNGKPGNGVCVKLQSALMFFINVSTFGRAPWPSILAKTILVASDKNPDGTGLGRTKRSEGSNLMESSHHKRKSWRVGERANRILPLSLVCGFLSVSLLSSTAGGSRRGGLWQTLAQSLTSFPSRKEQSLLGKCLKVLEKGSDWH